MSYIFNNKIAYSDGPNLDAFGRLRTAAVQNLVDIKHVYDKNPLQISEVTGGTITSEFSQVFARVRMSAATSGSYVIRQTKTHPIYQPGKSQLFEGSFSNFQIQTNVIKRVGCYTSTTAATYDSQFDGFFLESNGITSAYTFNIYRTGTLVYSADSTSWVNSEFDPSNINWSNTMLMKVDYQWLGVGRMRFGMIFSGQSFYFTEHNTANNEPNVYMSSPNQPIRYEIRSSGGTGYLDMICSQVSSEGALNGLYSTTSVPSTGTTTLTSNTQHSYIGIRLKQDYKSVVSELFNTSILNTSAGKRDFEVSVQFNPTLSYTPTWVDIANSPFQYSLGTGGTHTVATKGYSIYSFVGGALESQTTLLDFSDNQIRIGSNVNGTLDEMWLCITPLGANSDFRGTLNARYYL